MQSFDDSEERVGAGEIDGAIVDREPFLRRATSNAADRASAD